jgi:hypothetical protein
LVFFFYLIDRPSTLQVDYTFTLLDRRLYRYRINSIAHINFS